MGDIYRVLCEIVGFNHHQEDSRSAEQDGI